MDLISSLSSAMGIDETTAKALAGAAMGTVAAEAEQDEPQAAGAMREAVPEMDGWLEQAQQYAAEDEGKSDEGGLMGSLMGMASSGAGNQLLGAVGGAQAQHAALLAGVLSKAGLDTSMATMAAPMVLQFLQSRLDQGTLSKLMAVAPFLTGTAPAGASGVMGALGGMFGGD